MSRSTVVALRGCLVLLGLLTLFGQALYTPLLAAELAHENPELASLAAPYTVVVIAVLGCGQLVLVAVWALLAMVRRGAIFSERAFRWVDLIVAAAVVATLLAAGLGGHLLFVVGVGGPSVLVGEVMAVVGGCAVALLTVVMRGLLRTATALESDLAGVV